MKLENKIPQGLSPIVIMILLTTILFITCGKDDKAEIVGCNSVKYKGHTYTHGVACAPGLASFDVTTTEDGHTASFHITCSNGCIETVEAIGSSNQAITAP